MVVSQAIYLMNERSDHTQGASMKKVTLLFFATLRDITGERRILKTIPDDMLVSGLKEALVEEFPGLKAIISSVIVSMDHEFAFDDSPILPDAEIALFPPVSGGGS